MTRAAAPRGRGASWCASHCTQVKLRRERPNPRTLGVVPLLVLAILLPLALIALLPLSLLQRYRRGTSRQRARRWLATINAVGLTLSAAMFLVSAAVTSFWVPDALPYTAGGLLGGMALGVVGLRLTRWEAGVESLHYTPNRLLVLTVTLIVTARLLYGFVRAWNAWRAGFEGASWFAAAGLAGSMAAGALVLGYYLAYWLGVRRRLRRQLARPIRRL